MEIPVIERKLFKLRPWHSDDAQSLVKHANNPRIASNLRDGFPYPYSISDAKSWLNSMVENRSNLIMAIEIDGEAAGGIGIFAGKDVYRYNGELGYWLSEVHWGKGIMSEAVGVLVDYAFEHSPWLRIFANIFENNRSSMRVLEKNGFQHEATHKKAVMKEGKLLDEHLFARMKS